MEYRNLTKFKLFSNIVVCTQIAFHIFHHTMTEEMQQACRLVMSTTIYYILYISNIFQSLFGPFLREVSWHFSYESNLGKKNPTVKITMLK